MEVAAKRERWILDRIGILVLVAIFVASVSSGQGSVPAPLGTPGTIAHGAVPVKIKKKGPGFEQAEGRRSR